MRTFRPNAIKLRRSQNQNSVTLCPQTWRKNNCGPGKKSRERESKEKLAFLRPMMANRSDSCRYKYHEEKLGDIKAAGHLIIEYFVAGGRSDGSADSLLLYLRNNDAPKQTVGS